MSIQEISDVLKGWRTFIAGVVLCTYGYISGDRDLLLIGIGMIAGRSGAPDTRGKFKAVITAAMVKINGTKTQ